MTPADAIREARNLLFEHGWTQFVPVTDDTLCILTAAARATKTEDWKKLPREIINPIYLAIQATGFNFGGQTPYKEIYLYNDARGRTFDEIIDVLDKAEKIAAA